MKATTNTTKPARRTQGMNWIRKSTRLAIYLRDGLACAYCGATIEDGTQLTLDHLKPYSNGGTNEPRNLVTCCAKCNSVRQDRGWVDFAADVAAYLDIEADAIRRHISNCRRRNLDRKTANLIIKRRGSWSEVVENGFS
jgi:hypothetical protein